ncbi:MAG: DUF91 domain-containing protein [Proteobacteria bacterium]|nr:DUF91 domain-containing protein [Desulfobacteraceae bacterium]MBU4013100.1 DUF91 domain-containing protein [Pseudomonadota bacterium]MBU4100884.1 DUF91 domain-containing protein [Pseudomonadota bacterium]
MAQIIAGDKFSIKEFPFEDEVHDLADFIVAHPEILGAEVTILARELQVPTAAGQKRIDFLAFDTENNQIDIVELKKAFADEKVLLQTLRYSNWIRNNPDTVRYHVKKEGVNINPEEIDTDSIKVIIVAPKISRTLAELCQYITAFDFEFIELQRFKDANDKVYAITDRLEVETIQPTPPTWQDTYDLSWYKQHAVRDQQISDLENAISALTGICDENAWDLRARYVKWSVRFQTTGGRNAFLIHVRKTQSHHLSFCLGEDFDLSKFPIPEKLKKSFHHKKGSRWWKTDLAVDELKSMVPLMEISYQNVMK